MSRISLKASSEASKIFGNETEKFFYKAARTIRRIRNSRERQFKAPPFTPNVEYRNALPYVAVRENLSWRDIEDEVPLLIRKVYEWINSNCVIAVGAPFVRYLVVDCRGSTLIYEVEVGIAVAEVVSGDKNILSGTIPGGNYAFTCCSNIVLFDTENRMSRWARENNIQWQVQKELDLEVWHGSFKYYLTNPAEERNIEKWKFEIAILMAEPITE